MRFRGAILFALSVVAWAKSPLAGTWEGKVNDLPAVKLTVAETGADVAGTILFYFQTRREDGKWRVVESPDAGGPILTPRIDGNVLTFEVKHHKRHGGTEYGPNKKYSVELAGPKEARLRELGEAKPGAGLKLTRVD